MKSQSKVRSLTFSILIGILWRKPANPMLKVTWDTLCFKLHHLAWNANSSCPKKNVPLTLNISRAVFTHFYFSCNTNFVSKEPSVMHRDALCKVGGTHYLHYKEGAAAQLLLALRPAGWWWISIHHEMLTGSVH